jgi:integrase
LRVLGDPRRSPRRRRNIDRRPREYLTPGEVETLMATARRRRRNGHRDATMILLAYRHGLRVSELCRLEWSQVDFANGLLHVARLKGSISTTHPLRGVELRALRRLKREQEPSRHIWRRDTTSIFTAMSLWRTLKIMEIGRGARCGEYVRRFWQPICFSDELGNLPRLVVCNG